MDYLQYNFRFAAPVIEKTPFVLNLIINGLPSILYVLGLHFISCIVLNLIINGLPSILSWSTIQHS